MRVQIEAHTPVGVFTSEVHTLTPEYEEEWERMKSLPSEGELSYFSFYDKHNNEVIFPKYVANDSVFIFKELNVVSVRVIDPGSDKIQTIKWIRSITGASLKDAKAMSEGSILDEFRNLTTAQANEIIGELNRKTGATLKIIEKGDENE